MVITIWADFDTDSIPCIPLKKKIPWLPWDLVHLLLPTLCKTCQEGIQNVVYLYSTTSRCSTNLYHCLPRCHTHISKFRWAIPFLFFRPSGESSGWNWRVSLLTSDWSLYSWCTLHCIHTFTTPTPQWHVRHSHITQGGASIPKVFLIEGFCAFGASSYFLLSWGTCDCLFAWRASLPHAWMCTLSFLPGET